MEFIKNIEHGLDLKITSFQDKYEILIQEVGDIKGDIKVILDRTSGNRPSTIKVRDTLSNIPPPH